MNDLQFYGLIIIAGLIAAAIEWLKGEPDKLKCWNCTDVDGSKLMPRIDLAPHVYVENKIVYQHIETWPDNFVYIGSDVTKNGIRHRGTWHCPVCREGLNEAKQKQL